MKPPTGPVDAPPPSGAERPDRGLSRAQRLTRTADFRSIFANGRRYVGRYMVLWARASEAGSLRLGVVSSRKVGGAVSRNRARRRLREAWRLNRHHLSGKVDVVLVARRAVVRATAFEVESELRELCRRAGL